uniref:WD repeat-containing protein 19-like n=1 Tax=Styela clava TaxID=7725 RepID=UPI00193A09E8|nr:WD repeat-containing protein 19-like [Styela clava]
MKRMFSLNKAHGSETSVIFRWQKKLGNYLATTGHDHVIRIWDRHGQIEEEVVLPSPCTGLEWDHDGGALAAICEKSSTLFIWDANQHKVINIDSGAKDGHTHLMWSKTDLCLAVGTSKGNVILYDHKVGRKVPILGKHNKKIVCGAWSYQNKFALGGVDNTVTISDKEGKTLFQFNVRDTPSLMQFSEMKGNTRSDLGENTVSLVVGRKTLYLYNMSDTSNPIELAFQSRYGKIESYRWYGDGYIMIGFSNGYLVVISTHVSEIGQELFQVRNHHDYLSCVTISQSLNAAASCGDSSIRIHDLRELSEITAIINIEDEPKGLKEIQWTDDGQLLAVSGAKGNLHCYLTKLPMLGDTHGTKIAYLTSLLEVTVINPVEGAKPIKIPIDVEPAFIACGPYHIAAGMNNRAWFYFVGEDGAERLKDREYLGTIQSMHLNSDYAAVMFEGKVQLHMLDATSNMEDRETKLFPERDDLGKVTSCDITNEYLIYSTDMGSLHFFSMEDWNQVNVFRHANGIRSIHQDYSGTRLVIVDDQGQGFIYNPVNDALHKIPDFPSNIQGLVWERYPYDKGVFIVYDETNILTYVYHRESLNGPHVNLVGITHLPFSQHPLLLYNGNLSLQLTNGKINTILLDTHSFLKEEETEKDEDSDVLQKNLSLAISLCRWREAWSICASLNKKKLWLRLGMAAITALDLDLAVRVYRCVQDAGMVLSLQQLRDIEDSNLLAGTLASYIGDFELAQELLLNSGTPSAALDMRRDLLHWDTAMQLAQTLDPEQIPFIAKEYAQQLEFTGNYPSALSHYEKGLTRRIEYKQHDEICIDGITRMSIRQGDIRRGVTQAKKSGNRQLKKECAAILESMRQFPEAAELYEEAEFYEKATAVYIRCKNWNKVGELLPNVTSPKLHLQYAKAKETDGKFAEAALAYRNAKDFENEIRVYLDHLQKPDEAVRIVKETGSIEGASMVARFFIRLGDYASAIQFLVLSKCNDEAFQMAQQHGQMEIYAEIIGTDATPNDLQSIAVYFENERNYFLSGKFYYLAGLYNKAIKHLIKSALSSTTVDETQAIELGIETASKSKDQSIVQTLISFLIGENDGVPKDPKHLFRLYMSLDRYHDAAQTAIIISKEEQKSGSYASARDLLFSMMKELKDRDIKIPSEMESNLLILHSYILARSHIKRGDHLKAARMLIRVAENISKFPGHIVPILTSTVVECHKSGLRASSFSYAAMLMRPEYRNKIDEKYKRKIEQIVRKSGGKGEDEEEPDAPCPFCNYSLSETELLCPSCKSQIPYCIATGRHIVKTDMCVCPSCDFPALYSEFQKFLDSDPTCPMCSETVLADTLVRVKDTEKYLKKQ